MNPITFNYTGAIQNYRVLVSGTYDLSAYGAGGGSATGPNGNTGGSGARIGATFDLIAGQQLQIIVGGVGSSSSTGNGAGGGGFSQILVNSGVNGAYVPLLIAGGGGGANSTSTFINSPSGNASVSNPGTLGEGGRGGGATSSSASGSSSVGAGGGGGAGATTDGATSSSTFGGPGGQGGRNVANGAEGGSAQTLGGFGGGGGGGGFIGDGFGGGGGGGGATGGRGGSGSTAIAGSSNSGAGGGTSYIAATGVQNFAETASGSGVSTGDGSATLRFVRPALTVDDVSLVEGNSGTREFTFTVTLSAVSDQTVTIDYATADDTALAGSDYQSVSGSLIFAPGVTTQQVTVNVTGDTVYEADQRFFLNLRNASAGAVIIDGQGSGTITNDDTAPTYSIAVSPVSADEGNPGPGSTLTYTVTRNGSTEVDSTVAVGFTGTATGGTDYTVAGLTNGAVAFTASGPDTQTFTVTTSPDTVFETDETVIATLSTGSDGGLVTGGPATGTITNDDPAPSFAVSDVTVAEGNSGTTAATFTVTMTGATALPISVNYATADGTALAGTDYTTTSGTLTFTPTSNATSTQTVTVPVAGDTVFEAAELFTLNLSGATNGATITDAQGSGTITNDDQAPTLALSPAISSRAEGNTGTTPFSFNVTRTGDAQQSQTVQYAVTGSGANPTDPSDFDSPYLTGVVSFSQGQTQQQIVIPAIGDTTFEPDETFTVTLSNPSIGTITTASQTGTIINDDAAPPPPSDPTPPSPTAGDDNLVGSAGADTLSLGRVNDTYAGGAGSDLAYGNQGNDLIYGNQDADTLYGGQGDDRLFGNLGNDVLYGNRGADIVYGNQGNDIVYGNQGNDIVYGNQGADILFGGQGNDVLYGGQGADTLVGGIGDDILVGGLGADLYRFDPSSGRDLILGFNQQDGDRIALGGQTYTVSSAQNGDALLILSGGGTVDLAGIRASQVNASYFAT